MQASKTPAPPPKLGRVATIGYTQPHAWQIVSRMVAEQGWHLVDIRLQLYSYLAEWSPKSLRWHFGYSYHAVPELGDRLYPEHDQPVYLADPAAGLAKVGSYLEVGFDCLLLCACANWQYCHRRQVAALLQQAYPALAVSHLVPDHLAVDLPLWCYETVALLERYGLLKPLPHGPAEQPVLVRTNKSQQVILPDYGHCTIGLAVTLWFPGDLQHQEQGDPALPQLMRKEPHA